MPRPSLLRPFALICAFIAVTLSAADWPQWRGPARTGYIPDGVAVPATLAADIKPLWHMAIGEGFASPVVCGGKVFYLDTQAGQEVVHAVEAATGKELWKTNLDSVHRDGFGQGPRTAPVADGNLVFAQSCKGELKCLKAEDGSEVWHKNFVTDFGAIYIGEKGTAAGASRHGATGSPIVDGDNLIAQVGSAKDASIVCFKKATGEVVWKSQKDQTAYAAPIIATVAGRKQFISFTIEGLIGLDTTDGKLLWRAPMTTRLGRHVTTPVVVDDKVLVASHQLGLVATRVVAPASGAAGTEAGATLKAEPAWVEKPMLINFASPVVVGKHLYGVGPAKNLVCIDTETGKTAWSKLGVIQTPPDKSFAAFLVAGKNILMLTDTGLLVLFAADPAEYKEIARTQVCGLNWCLPAYVDGKLYMRDAKELLCVELMK
ncbi:MAG TPA: PQQ-binding-like beta-propeller repeat protein [Planctomycetota bacterium]|jgi:outer membrane protein assembly factor BamB